MSDESGDVLRALVLKQEVEVIKLRRALEKAEAERDALRAEAERLTTLRERAVATGVELAQRPTTEALAQARREERERIHGAIAALDAHDFYSPLEMQGACIRALGDE